MDSAKISYGKLTVTAIPTPGVDQAWAKGASDLSKACEMSTDGVTPELLKYMLLKGEKHLFAIVEALENGGTEPRGWFVASIVQSPLANVFYIYAAVGKGCTTTEVIEQTKLIAKNAGCTKIECSSKEPKLIHRYQEIGFLPKHQTLTMEC
jgi:hypothetical protein